MVTLPGPVIASVFTVTVWRDQAERAGRFRAQSGWSPRLALAHDPRPVWRRRWPGTNGRAPEQGQPGGGRGPAPAAGLDRGGQQRPIGRGGRGGGAAVESALGDGDHHQDEAPEPVANSTAVPGRRPAAPARLSRRTHAAQGQGRRGLWCRRPDRGRHRAPLHCCRCAGPARRSYGGEAASSGRGDRCQRRPAADRRGRRATVPPLLANPRSTPDRSR
jgi:hypothetical protein